jgi:hypothetical protein
MFYTIRVGTSQSIQKEEEKTMNQYKVFTVVVFMICLSLITFVSQGEEWIEEETTVQDDDIAWSTSTSNHSEVKTHRAVDASELKEKSSKSMPDLHGPIRGVKEEISSHEAIAFEEIPEAKDMRLQEIVENTPLDTKAAEIILKYADEYGLRVSLILGLIDLESNFNQYLVGTSQDRGYMQIIPGTEKWLAEAYGEALGLNYDTTRIFDANYNIPLGMRYLSLLKDQYGNETQMLTSYNRGDYGMEKWFKEHGTYETTYSRVVLKRASKYRFID